MGTTSRGYPYPEGNGLVIQGDDAIQALAEAINADLTNRRWAIATGEAGESVAADTDWTLDYSAMDGSGFTPIPDGGVAPRFTYTGPTGRWFHLSVGVSVGGAGSSSITLRLHANSGIVASAITGADSDHLSISLPLQLTNGTDLSASLHIAGAAGSFSYPWLRAVEL